MVRKLIPLLAVAAALVLTASAAAKKPSSTLEGYAADTWHSFDLMLYPETGLVADNVSAEGVRARYTSPTNIGTYLWSTIAARDLGLISNADAVARIDRTLDTVETLERHNDSGQFYNWYDPQTGQKLTIWPNDGSTVSPFLSSVDNGWLAAALVMVANAVPERAAQARAIYDSMHFGYYYDPGAGLHPRRLLARSAAPVQHLRRGQGRLLHVPPLRGAQHRAADRELHRDRHRRDPGDALLQDVAHVPGHLRLVVAGDEARGRDAELPRRRRLRGPLHLRGDGHRPELGRLDVRGADGAAARPRGAVGTEELGRQPSALRATRRSTTA